jgi:AcrR family transcriptional regulator
MARVTASLHSPSLASGSLNGTIPDSDGAAERPPEEATLVVDSRRGRPRDDAIDDRILAAAISELARCGISHFSVSAVARKAGVAKGSIYLRWPTREQLMLAASQQLITPIKDPAPNPFRAQLAELARAYAVTFHEWRSLEVILRIDADRDRHPDLFREMFAKTQGSANSIVERTIVAAQERGEIDPTVPPALVVRILTGTLFVEALSKTPAGAISETFLRNLVDFMTDRLEARPAR